jgi:transcriptional regulator with XRE-family HTH domain
MAHQKKRIPLEAEDRALYKALGTRIARRREEIKLTQVQVAAALGIAQQTYAAYEIGRRRFPVSLLCALAEALKTDVNFILGFPAKTAPSKRGTPRR